MHNYININKLSFILIATVYISMAFTMNYIEKTASSSLSALFFTVNNIILLFILYKFNLSIKVILTTIGFMILFAASFSYNIIFFFIFILNIFGLYFFFSLIKLHFQTKKLYKYNYLYINQKTFKPRPFLLLVILNIYNIIAYTPFFITNSMVDDYSNIFEIYIICAAYTIFTAGFMYVFYKLLYKYRSAYAVISLSSNRKIYASLLYKTSSLRGSEWFEKTVMPYVYYAHYNSDNNIITFDDEDDIISIKSNNKTVEYSLDNAIYDLKLLLEDENISALSTTLSSIIDKLNKINNIHKEKYQFNKYIYHINEKYVPYIKSLVQAYCNNMQLGLDITKNMQEKIISSLEKVNITFEKMINEMYNKNMLELESYMEAMDIVLNQTKQISNN